MTITAQRALIEQYTGNGTQRDWPVTFPFLAEQDLGVIITAPDTQQRKLLLHKDYSIRRMEDHPGGTVTVEVPDGHRLTIYLEQPCTQEMDLRNNGILDAEMLEYSLDKLTLLVGQLRDRVGLCVRNDITDTRSPQEVFNELREALFAARHEAVASAGQAISTVEAALLVAARVEAAAEGAEASAEAARQIAGQGNEDATEDIKGITRLATEDEHLEGCTGVAAQPAHVAAMIHTVLGAAVPTPDEGDIGKALVVDSDLTLGFGSGFPAGGIILWSGATTTIPAGWVLCDGANGTPDLRDRFVVGAGGTYAVKAAGGSSTTGETTLTTAQMPAHTHDTRSHAYGFPNTGSNFQLDNRGSGYATASTGGGESHAHSSMPPYYSLAYIMKL